MTSLSFVYAQLFLNLDLCPISWQGRVVHYQSHMYILDYQLLVDHILPSRIQLGPHSNDALMKVLTDTNCHSYIFFICRVIWSLVHNVFAFFLIRFENILSIFIVRELHYNGSWRVFTADMMCTFDFDGSFINVKVLINVILHSGLTSRLRVKTLCFRLLFFILRS